MYLYFTSIDNTSSCTVHREAVMYPQTSVAITTYSHCRTYSNGGYVIHGSNSCQIWKDLSKIAYEKA